MSGRCRQIGQKERTVEKVQAATMLALVEEADKALNWVENAQLAEKVRLAHEAAERTFPTEADKVDIPRRGDIVAEVDQDGEIGQTWTVARKPSSITILREVGSHRRSSVNTAKLRRIGQNVWKFA